MHVYLEFNAYGGSIPKRSTRIGPSHGAHAFFAAPKKPPTLLAFHSGRALCGQHCQMGLPAAEIETIQSAALLHDIGLLTLPTVALHKMPFLTRREQALYKKHPDLGSNMLETIPACQHIIPYIRHHHERWDGTGFPKHLRGVNIPLGARIIAVADYYEQITNPSAENWAKTKQEALNELFSASGLLFDPSIVRVFIDILS